MEPGLSGVPPTVAVVESPDLSGDESDSADTTLSGDMLTNPRGSI